MNNTESRSHQPKGGMCVGCVKRHDDCSNLPFEKMKVIETLKNGVKVVRCSEYENRTRGNTLQTYENHLRELDNVPQNELEDYLILLDKIWWSMPQCLKDEHMKGLQNDTGQAVNTRTI